MGRHANHGGRLTRSQQNVLMFVERYIGEHGQSPTLQEIADAFAYRSLATVYEYLGVLERKGWIKRLPREARGVMLINGSSARCPACGQAVP